MKSFFVVVATMLGLAISSPAQTTNVIEWQTNWPLGTSGAFTNIQNLPTVSSWFTGTAAALSSVSNGVSTNLLATDLSTSSLTWLTYFASSNNPVNLSPGMTVQVVLDFFVQGTSAQNDARNVRFGIFGCTNQMVVNNGNPKQTNYLGYAQYMNFCNPFGNQPFSTVAATNYSLSTVPISDAVFAKSAELVSIEGAGGGTTNDPGFLDNTPYTLYLSVTENNPTNVSITTQFVGANLNTGSISQTVTDTNYCWTSFNSFVMRLGSGTGSAQYWYFTSFKVITISPVTVPPVLTHTLAGSVLTLSWDPAYIGWTLQSQTNSSSVGLASNWATVAGSSTTNKVIVPTDLSKGAVFFRLISP